MASLPLRRKTPKIEGQVYASARLGPLVAGVLGWSLLAGGCNSFTKLDVDATIELQKVNMKHH